MSVTIKDVAKLANVSTATVSLVVNQKAHRISAKTKLRVQEAIKNLGYQPNYTARSLVSSQSFTIGLIVPEITNPFFSEFARNLEKNFHKFGYLTFLCNSGEDLSLEERYIDKLIGHSVDGLIICGLSEKSKAKIPLLKKHKIPFLILDNRRVKNDFSIGIDDYAGGQLVANHLIELNHQVCAFVGDFSGYSNILRRYKGFAHTLTKAGKELIMFTSALTQSGGQQVAKQIFDSRATAIFCSNDLIAVGIYEQANLHGINLPEDLSIVGFDDISFANILSPKLTTIRQPVEEMALIATDYIVRMIIDKQYQAEAHILPVELLIRQSTASPPNKERRD